MNDPNDVFLIPHIDPTLSIEIKNKCKLAISELEKLAPKIQRDEFDEYPPMVRNEVTNLEDNLRLIYDDVFDFFEQYSYLYVNQKTPSHMCNSISIASTKNPLIDAFAERHNKISNVQKNLRYTTTYCKVAAGSTIIFMYIALASGVIDMYSQIKYGSMPKQYSSIAITSLVLMTIMAGVTLWLHSRKLCKTRDCYNSLNKLHTERIQKYTLWDRLPPEKKHQQQNLLQIDETNNDTVKTTRNLEK
jgi:hypothetical protein